MQRHPLRLARGGLRLGRLLASVVPDYLDYLRPGFHPGDDDNRALIARYKQQVEAAVVAQFCQAAALAA